MSSKSLKSRLRRVKTSSSLFARLTFAQLLCKFSRCHLYMTHRQVSTFHRCVHFPQVCTLLNPKQRWNVLQLAIKDIVDQFVDIDYPSSASKDDDHVRAYAKEVISLGLLYKEFVDAIREGDGERIIRCWRYFLPLLTAV